MRKLALGFCSVLFASMAGVVSADTECTDRPECWPEGSSMHTALLLLEQRKASEQQLLMKHNELVALVLSSSLSGDQRLVQALKTQQEAWLKYRSEECELIGSLTGAGGTWPSTYANRCEVNLTDQRLGQVQLAIRCVNKTNADNRIYEQYNCLQQLAPLANQ